MIAAIFELVTVASLSSSVILGLVIGAFYGYEIAPAVSPRFPLSLFVIGVAFIVLITAYSLTDISVAVPDRVLAFGIGRTILWLVTCASIPIGREIRGRIALAVARRRAR